MDEPPRLSQSKNIHFGFSPMRRWDADGLVIMPREEKSNSD